MDVFIFLAEPCIKKKKVKYLVILSLMNIMNELYLIKYRSSRY